QRLLAIRRHGPGRAHRPGRGYQPWIRANAHRRPRRYGGSRRPGPGRGGRAVGWELGETGIRGTPAPPPRETVAADLRALGIEPGMTVLVHSSLRSLGWVSGGPVAVVQALMDALTEEGTLVMPGFCIAHSDPAQWQAPPVPVDWVSVIRE